jgi:2-phosphoglycerate kinase
MRPALAAVVDGALADGRRLVVEGEALDPRLAARYSRDARVRPLFVVELDRERLARTLRGRSPSFTSLPLAEQSSVARTNALYCQWLTAECRERSLPWIASQPWDTLGDRAKRVLESPRPGG